MSAAEEKQRRINSEFYIEGFATTFNKPYILFEDGGTKYSEIIDRNALDGADMSDIILQYDHTGKVLARNSNNTLGVEVTDRGLFVFADLSKSRAAQELYEEVKNGLITKMSWAFKIDEYSYNKDTHTWTITKISKVFDVSAVSHPANGNTDISARSYFNGEIEKEKQELLARRVRILKLKINTEVKK